MNYLSNVANERPMLRVAATVIFAFFCAAPLVLLFSSLVVLGVRSLFTDRRRYRSPPAQRASARC